MRACPIVSVVIPVYNGFSHLGTAIESIQQQTLQDFEIVVVDDGSVDQTPNLLDRLCKADGRIRVFRQDNLGVSQSLNRGISESLGEFIARMDADDIALPSRLMYQIEFLRQHPQVDMCGSSIQTFGDTPSVLVRHPSDHESIACQLLFTCCIAHPTVMFRRESWIVNGCQYSPEYPTAQDYRLWAELCLRLKMANVPAVLLNYRVHSKQISQGSGVPKQQKLIWRYQLERLGIPSCELEVDLHERLANERYVESLAFLEDADNWLQKLWNANQKSRLYSCAALALTLARIWQKVCANSESLWPRNWESFFNSPLASPSSDRLFHRLKLHCKRLIPPAWRRRRRAGCETDRSING